MLIISSIARLCLHGGGGCYKLISKHQLNGQTLVLGAERLII